MEKIKSFFTGITFRVVLSVVVFLSVFGLSVSWIGYEKFTESLTAQYEAAAFSTAKTATMLIDVDRIEAYLESDGQSEDYVRSKGYLDALCVSQGVSIVYVIVPDATDYKHFVSVFNSPNPDTTSYTPWEIGTVVATTNDEYAAIYKNMYENGLLSATVVRDVRTEVALPHITYLKSLVGSDGTTKGILCVQRPMEELRQGRQSYLNLIAIVTAVLIAVVAALFGLFLRFNLVRPIGELSAEAKRFASESKKGDIDWKAHRFRSLREIKVLSTSMVKMETETLEYMKNLTLATAEKERIGTELQVASVIQEGAIPSVYPAFPDRTDFDLFGMMTPAKEVGGDFYDFYLVDEDHLAVVMADVSGKGVPAALFMMVSKILIKESVLTNRTPAETLTFVNERVLANNNADMFVTVWLGVIDLKDGSVKFANAGHDDALVVREGGEVEFVKSKHGPVIGAMEGVRYKEYEFSLKRGEKLFLYTDGLPEAMDVDKKMFGMDRVMARLFAGRGAAPKEIVESIETSVKDFVKDAPRFDDLTTLCFEYKGGGQEESLTVLANAENEQKVYDFVQDFLIGVGASDRVQKQFRLCAEEIYVNIKNYAYHPEIGPVCVSIRKEGTAAYLTFMDGGMHYDPLAKPDPDLTLSADEREVGGLGIYLVKKNMDEVTYSYVDGKNILTLKKSLS
ncbi:MAG: SpoIIE family protein phosphatase [Clostridia bacterium]|nr:SpoIIE family protein phosphatase [Clostridia bacterium]